MKRAGMILGILLLVSVASLTAETAADGKAALATVKKLVGFIRYEKNDLALRQVGLEPVSQYLLGGYYEQASAEQKARFQSLLGEYIELRAFPLALKYFKDIDLSYDEPAVQGDSVRIRSSLLYGGSEQVVFTWVLAEHAGQYVITDFLDQRGVSSMQVNRDKQIQPVLKQKGVPGLLQQMEQVVAQARTASN
jgi:ABC-type transporter MlaC component